MADATSRGPSGTVTFLFSDVEGSTPLWASAPEAMAASLFVHDRVVRSGIESNAGYVFGTAGDSFHAAFGRPSDAVRAASAIQENLAVATWPGPVLRVRVGIHLGEAWERDGDYFGPVVNLAARVESAGHGGQVLLTDAVQAATGLQGLDLGEHQLRGVEQPVRIWQLGDGSFPHLRTKSWAPTLPYPGTTLLGRQDLIGEIRRLLRSHRMVTLAATGGSGKTRLAMAGS